MSKVIGYNVYMAADGCAEEFYGFAKTLKDARSLAKGNALPASMYATAEAAGHCDGISSPDKSNEDESRTHWLTDTVCAVPVVD